MSEETPRTYTNPHNAGFGYTDSPYQNGKVKVTAPISTPLRVFVKLPSAELQVDGDPVRVHAIYDSFMQSMERASGLTKTFPPPVSGDGEMTDEQRLAASLGIGAKPRNADLSHWGHEPEPQT